MPGDHRIHVEQLCRQWQNYGLLWNKYRLLEDEATRCFGPCGYPGRIQHCTKRNLLGVTKIPQRRSCLLISFLPLHLRQVLLWDLAASMTASSWSMFPMFLLGAYKILCTTYCGAAMVKCTRPCGPAVGSHILSFACGFIPYLAIWILNCGCRCLN